MKTLKHHFLAPPSPVSAVGSQVNVVFQPHDTLNLAFVWFLRCDHGCIHAMDIHEFFERHTNAKIDIEKVADYRTFRFADIRYGYGGIDFCYLIDHNHNEVNPYPKTMFRAFTKVTARTLWDTIIAGGQYEPVSEPYKMLSHFKAALDVIDNPQDEPVRREIAAQAIYATNLTPTEVDKYALQA